MEALTHKAALQFLHNSATLTDNNITRPNGFSVHSLLHSVVVLVVVLEEVSLCHHCRTIPNLMEILD